VAIITAIDWFFESEPQGIILEDDLLVKSDFFDFVARGLDEFRNDASVWMISGDQFLPKDLESSKVSWSYYPLIWGWQPGQKNGWRCVRTYWPIKRYLGY
jgi:hypothetical protein